MEAFLKTLVILLFTPINAQLQPSTINPEPSTPNIFTAPPSPQPNIGVNGRGIFTGTPLASHQGPHVTLHSYPWLTYNKLVNADSNKGKTLVYNDDTSFALPPQALNPPLAGISSIPVPPKLPNLPQFPAPSRTSRKTRSVIAPQIIQAQTAPNFQLGNAFPQLASPQFPSFPFPYPIPYTIITQVIPVFPVFGVAPPMVSAESSAVAEAKPIVKPEVETGGEFSGGTEIEAPYPAPVTPDLEAEGEFVGEAEIKGPYPEPVKPDVGGDSSGEAMIASYPAAVPESEGEAVMEGPYPAPALPVVSGDASGAAMIEGPYPAALKPEVVSESLGPYPLAKPIVSGQASGAAIIKGPFKLAMATEKPSKVIRPIPIPVPVTSVVNEAEAIIIEALPDSSKPLEEIPSVTLKEFLLELEKPENVVADVGGEKKKGPYRIPKMAVAGVNLGEIMKPVVPTLSRGDRVSIAARLKEVVFPEYWRDASGRVVRFN